MGGKKAENTKKVAGNARKAEAAAQKQAALDAQKAVEEDREWQKGAKSNAKKEAADAKRAEAARKKAEKDAQLAEEEANARAVPKNAKAKAAPKKSRGTLDISQLDDEGSSAGGPGKGAALNASGLDNALDALSLTTNSNTTKVDRHPERRYKAAYTAFEARRLPEVEEEYPGLRRKQRVDLVRKEFEKSAENPFNQTTVAFDATREEIEELKQAERAKIEERLASK